MGLLSDGLVQAKVWAAYLQLNSADPERDKAIASLTEAGTASLPCMRMAVNQTNQPRVQFTAAVVLHRLGNPLGMGKLIEALQWRLPTNPALAPDIEAAFIRIGSPDAVAALLDVWRRIPDTEDQQIILTSICRVWAALRDPRALEALTARATRIPQLFLDTVPAFREMAVFPLERMVRDGETQGRLLGIQALSRIESVRSFDMLVPLLRDRNMEVRAAIPKALELTGGAKAASDAIHQAMKDGFSTQAAVATLAVHCPEGLSDTLIALVERWKPGTIGPTGDTTDAVQAAVGLLSRARWLDAAPAVCALLDRRPDARLCAVSARFLAARTISNPPTDRMARSALFPLLSDADATVRTEAAQALQAYGESFGVLALQALETCRPQGNLFQKLQVILRGGIDASQAATQAVQQVGQWLTRLSRETIEKMASPPTKQNTPSLMQDTRFPALVRRLLENSLDILQRSTGPEETEAAITLAATALRALARVGAPAALEARAAILRALHTVKRSSMVEIQTSAVRSEMRDIGTLVRMDAAETLIELYGKASYGLFLERVYAPEPETRVTAVGALGRLGDVRAVPILQALAGTAPTPSLAAAATEAIAAIRRTNPEMMTLLRGSSRNDTRPDMLLRPSYGSSETVAPELLLRATAQENSAPHENSASQQTSPLVEVSVGEDSGSSR